jgi:hypothetical protein
MYWGTNLKGDYYDLSNSSIFNIDYVVIVVSWLVKGDVDMY